MKRTFTAIILATAFSVPAQATECHGILHGLFGIDTGLSCEQRAALMGYGAQLSAPQPIIPAAPMQVPPMVQAPTVQWAPMPAPPAAPSGPTFIQRVPGGYIVH